MHKKRSVGLIISYANIIVNMVNGLVLSAFLLRVLGDVEFGLYQSVPIWCCWCSEQAPS